MLPHLLVVCCTLESWLFVSVVLRIFAREKVADAKIQKKKKVDKAYRNLKKLLFCQIKKNPKKQCKSHNTVETFA